MENLIKYIPTYFLYTLINMTFYLYFRAVFKFDQSNKLGVTATGKEFGDFKTHFEADERGFGYIRIKVSDIFIFAYPALFLIRIYLEWPVWLLFRSEVFMNPAFANRTGEDYICQQTGCNVILFLNSCQNKTDGSRIL